MQEAIPTRSVSEGTKLGMRDWKPSEEHKAKLVENIAKGRANITDESRRKQADARRGQTRDGVPWSEQTRASHSYRQTVEYREKLAAAVPSGENSKFWKGGYESRSPRGWEWRLRRKECYARDNWTCQDCGVKCVGARESDDKRRIQAHHVVARSEGGGDELENLVTLCASCHGKRDGGRRKSQGE